MANVTADSVSVRAASSSCSSCAALRPKRRVSGRSLSRFQLVSLSVRASQSMGDKNKVYKELGMFSLKKKIENAVLRAEMLAMTALEYEEAKRSRQEELLREHNMWEDVVKSNEILIKFADTTKVVNALKDLQYKAEEVKLISELAEMDAINYKLFKQAYDASIDVTKCVDQYEMSKLLSGPCDTEGACLNIRAGSKGINPEIWAEQLLMMYLKWAEKQGYQGRVVEKCLCEDGGIYSATLEFESKFAYGYLSGERGVHCIIGSLDNGSFSCENNLAFVDVIPLFLESAHEQQLDDKDLLISSLSPHSDEPLTLRSEPAVSILHTPTGISVQSSGERSHFANKVKALNRLKAKLLIIAMEQGVSSVKNIKADAIRDSWRQVIRRYAFHPYKLVQDIKTGTQFPDVNSVLDGNIEPFIRAHLSNRQASDKV